MQLVDMKIHHVGYLVKNLEKAQSQFESMGYRSEGIPVYDGYRGIDVIFLKKEGYRIELVCPRNGDSIVSSLCKKLGNTPYHICYEVDDIEQSVQELAKLRFVVWEQPHEAPAIDGRRIVFLISSQIGLIELVEK